MIIMHITTLASPPRPIFKFYLQSSVYVEEGRRERERDSRRAFHSIPCGRELVCEALEVTAQPPAQYTVPFNKTILLKA